MTVAILLAIKEFGDNIFSVHNITTHIRDQINMGSYELRDTLDKVSHNDVKDYFSELVENGFLSDYMVRHNPSGYREFSKNPTNATNTQPTPVSTTKIPTDIQVIVYKYMKNNGPVTIKQIQSRLKGHPYTCEDIAQFLDKINLIDPVSKILPYSRMSTVAI